MDLVFLKFTEWINYICFVFLIFWLVGLTPDAEVRIQVLFQSVRLSFWFGYVTRQVETNILIQLFPHEII